MLTRSILCAILSLALVTPGFAVTSKPFKPIPGVKPPLLKPIPFPKPPKPVQVPKPAAKPEPALIPSRGETTMTKYVGPYVMGVAFCGAISEIASAHVKGNVLGRGELTFREAHKAFWNCALPFVGGWMVDRAFDANPQWPNR